MFCTNQNLKYCTGMLCKSALICTGCTVVKDNVYKKLCEILWNVEDLNIKEIIP